MTQEIEVTCYSGYRANETPLSFRYRDKEYHVEKVLERRVEESTQNRERIHYFRVLCRNREIFSIYYNAAEDRWGGGAVHPTYEPPAAPHAWGGGKPLRGRSLPGAKLL